MILFCAAGWCSDLTLPANVAVVALAPDGKWCWRHAIFDRNIVDYLDTVFNINCYEERVERTVEAVFRQPGINYPLSAQPLSVLENIPIHLIVESFRRLAKKEGGLVVYYDQFKFDWVLDIR